jgi:TatD DNase family protein
MIADAHFHFDLLSDSVQADIVALTKPVGNSPSFAGISAGVWPNQTKALLQANQQSIVTAAHPSGIFLAAGLHPCEVHKHFSAQDKNSRAEAYDELASLAASGRLSAIGETGFDASAGVLAEALALGLDKPKLLELQWQAFRYCMDIADRHKLPLILHSRNAWSHTLQAIDQWLDLDRESKRRIMIHCYPGSASDVLPLAAKGVYLSFGGTITWPNARRPKQAVAACPLSQLLIETDAPDLAPVLADGTKPMQNSPFYWHEIVAAIATLRNAEAQQVAHAAYCNLRTFLTGT